MRRERSGKRRGGRRGLTGGRTLGRAAIGVFLAGVLVAGVLAAGVLALPGSAGAAEPAEGARAAAPAGLDDARLKLRGLQDSLDASEGRRRTLNNDIATYRSDRARFEASLLTLTARTADTEGKIADTERRLQTLNFAREAAQRSLQGRRAMIADVLAALQRMGRKPPPALLVEPADVLKAIRTSMLLGAVLPGMRAQTEALADDLAALTRTRRAIDDERRAVDADLVALAGERSRLSALIEARQGALGQAQGEFDGERDRARQLAGQAGTLKDLIARLEHDGGAAARAAEAARASDEKLAALMPGGVVPPGGESPAQSRDAGHPDPGRLAPAVAFAATRGQLALPAAGTVLRHFGEDDGLGGVEKGLLLSTRASAAVASPADGWIAYAGPYRSFGQLLILNAGGGYYIVLAGMDRVDVSLGQFVLAGEPVAAMGDGSTKTAAAVALGAVQPVLYVEFRKDGATIDPGPWWAKPELQRVRG